MDKNKKTFQVPTLLAFAAIVAIMVIVGVRVLNVPVVPMCLLVIIEAVIAVMLHHAELWVHGLLILAELCAGVAGKKTVLIILCAVVYIAATFALQMFRLSPPVSSVFSPPHSVSVTGSFPPHAARPLPSISSPQSQNPPHQPQDYYRRYIVSSFLSPHDNNSLARPSPRCSGLPDDHSTNTPPRHPLPADKRKHRTR